MVLVVFCNSLPTDFYVNDFVDGGKFYVNGIGGHDSMNMWTMFEFDS